LNASQSFCARFKVPKRCRKQQCGHFRVAVDGLPALQAVVAFDQQEVCDKSLAAACQVRIGEERMTAIGCFDIDAEA
jgi:hypothetical protein